MSQVNIFVNVLRDWGQSVQTGNVNGLYKYPALLSQVNDIGRQLRTLSEDMEVELQKSQKSLALTMLSMKAQAATDLLHRGLFERTADVGAMANNDTIRAILEKGPLDDEGFETLYQLLQNYVYEYSVYDDVVILDPEGETLVSLAGENSPYFKGSELVHQALNNPDYTEYFLIAPYPVLYYAQQIKGRNGQTIGIMVLSFQFEYEMGQEVFPEVLDGDEETFLLLITSEGKIAATSSDAFQVGTRFPDVNKNRVQINSIEYDVSIQDTNGYEGYMGFGLRGVALKRVVKKKKSQEKTSGREVDSAAVPAQLRKIITNVESVETDLHIVGLNGKLQAGREDDKTLPPILDGVREAGSKIRQKFQEAIYDLVQDTEIILTQKSDAISKMAMAVMDHNLYERANDVCWWANSDLYRTVLSQGTIDEDARAQLTAQLAATNDLYTVYDHLFIFDQHGIIQADSKPHRASQFVGQRLDSEAMKNALSNRNPKNYFVSQFRKTEMYDDRETYIYYASIFHPDGRQVVGGIGLVFDSEVQFQAILEECLEAENAEREGTQAFGLYIARNGLVVSTSNPDYPVGSVFDPKSIDSKGFIVHSAASAGYREYLRSDGYQADKECWIALPRG